jgi:hypothetical protein
MTQSERDAAYHKFLDNWGFDAQLMMCLEEMSELTKELCKYQRFGGEHGAPEDIRLHIVEEIADVYNTVDQMSLIFGRAEVEKIRDEKLARALKRLNNEAN